YAGVKISLYSGNNVIGGLTPDDRNIISGNGVAGIYVESEASGNLIAGNYIGTDVTGTVGISPNQSGLNIHFGPQLMIGGVSPEERNIISGNKLGVIFWDTGTSIYLQGNYIGTDVTGTLPVPNTEDGI